MKSIAHRFHPQTRKPALFALLLACVSLNSVARADDLSTPTPSPTPAYVNPLARPGGVRRIEQYERRRALETDAQSVASARAQAKANQRAAAAAQAQSREAARQRERAQRQVDAEARREKANETPHPSSEVMKRMGFSEQEIAAQQAQEAAAKAGSQPTASPAP